VKIKIVGDVEKKVYIVKPGYSIVVKEGEILKRGADYAIK
jgi:hypothetical protein